MSAKNNIYLLIGIPASGKTFYRNKKLSQLNYISCDEIRENIFGFERSFEIRKQLTEIIKTRIISLASHNFDFVIDSTYFNKRDDRTFLFENFPNHNIVAIFFDTPFESAILQNSLRPKHRVIEISMIKKFNDEIEPPAPTEPFHKVIKISYQT